MLNSILIDSDVMERIHNRNTAVLVAAVQSGVVTDCDMELYIQCTTEPVRLFNLVHVCAIFITSENHILRAVAMDINSEMKRIKQHSMEDAFALYIYNTLRLQEKTDEAGCKGLKAVLLNYIANSNHLEAIGSLCLVDSMYTTHYLTKGLLRLAYNLEKRGPM